MHNENAASSFQVTVSLGKIVVGQNLAYGSFVVVLIMISFQKREVRNCLEV